MVRKILATVLFFSGFAFAQFQYPYVVPGVAGDCGEYAANGTQITDSGSACGGSGTVNSGTAGQVAYYAGTGTAVSGTNAIPNGTTATTQGNAADSTTKLATNAFVQNAVALSMGTMPLSNITGTPATYSFDSQGSGATVVYLASGGSITIILTWTAAGSGYLVGDVITPAGGNFDAFIVITAINGSGQPTAGTILYGGTGYGTGGTLAQSAANAIQYTLLLSGVLGADTTFIMPHGTYLTQSNQWIIANNTTGAHTLTVCVAGATDACAGGRTVTVAQGTNNSASTFLQTDGELNVDLADPGILAYLTSGEVTGALGYTPQTNLSLVKGTLTDGDMCTYTASGTLLDCKTAVPSSSALASQPYVPAATNGTIGLLDQQPNGTAPVWNRMGVVINPNTSGCSLQYAVQERAVMYDPTPLVAGQPFEMWYHAGVATYDMYWATSVDGVVWNCQGNIAALAGLTQPRHVWRDGSGNIVLYLTDRTTLKKAVYNGSSWAVTATNLAGGVNDPYVFQHSGTTYVLWAQYASGWKSYLATSTDGLTGLAFTAYSGNPFITDIGSGSFAAFQDGSSNYWLWTQTSLGAQLTDIYRYKCTELFPTPSCTLNPSGAIYTRGSAIEGAGIANGQVADPSFVTDGTADIPNPTTGTPSVLANKTLMYYTSLYNQAPTAAMPALINLAVANMSLAQLVTTNEGAGPVPYDTSQPLMPGKQWIPAFAQAPLLFGQNNGVGTLGYGLENTIDQLVLGANLYYVGNTPTQINTTIGGGYLKITADTNANTFMQGALMTVAGNLLPAWEVGLSTGGAIGPFSTTSAVLCLGGLTAVLPCPSGAGIQSGAIGTLPRIFLGNGNNNSTAGALDFTQMRMAEYANQYTTASGYDEMWADPTAHTFLFNYNGSANYSVSAGLSAPNNAPSYTKTANATSCAATSGYTNTNTRGNVTVVGGTATTGTICTVNFSTTLSAAPGTCVVTETDGGAALFNLSHGVPSTTAFTVTAGLTVAAATVSFDYHCIP